MGIEPRQRGRRHWNALKAIEDGHMNAIADLKAKLDTAEAENVKLNTWIDDLQSGMYINCVYCGHRYGPSDETPVAMREVLHKHIEQCSKHPLSKMKAERDSLRAALEAAEKEGL